MIETVEAAEETVKTVERAVPVSDTPLKQGVNENSSRVVPLALGWQGLGLGGKVESV